MTTLHDMTAVDLLAAYKSKKLSPVEVTDAVIQRIEAWEPKIKALYAPARPIFRAVGFNPVRTAWSLNSVVREKAALSPAFRADLDHYFADDIAQVEQLLGRQLWRDLRPASPKSIATDVGTAA